MISVPRLTCRLPVLLRSHSRPHILDLGLMTATTNAHLTMTLTLGVARTRLASDRIPVALVPAPVLETRTLAEPSTRFRIT